MLILTFGPCILNRLLAFIKDKLNIVQAMVLTQQYQALRTEEEAQDWASWSQKEEGMKIDLET